MRPRSPALMRIVAATAFALSVAAVVDAQPPSGQPDKKDEKKDAKPPEPKWPTEIAGKDVNATAKDLEDSDPVIREFAARTLPGFGPGASKTNISKVLLKRMQVERDPGVKAAVYAAVGGIQFESELHNIEAMRLLLAAIDGGGDGSSLRLAAVQAVTQWGNKGGVAIVTLCGKALSDPSYGTRQHIATALGRCGFDEISGPNMRALAALADKLAKDDSAAVRMQAMSSLLELGPPWAAPKAKDAKTNPPTDTKSVDVIVRHMRARVGDPKAKIPAVEKDKQVEIWARLVLMRFDPKEVNDENLDAIARYLTGADDGVKVQALQAITMLGETAARKLNDVVRVMEDKDAPFQVTVGAITALGTLGASAKPGLPNMQKFLELKKKELAEKKLEQAKKKENKDDLKLIGEIATLEAIIKLLEEAIKHIETAKPTSPAELKTDPKSSDPPKKP